MTRTLDRKIKFRLGLALLPVLVVAWYAFQVPRDFVDTVGHRRESFEFLERLSNIVLLLQEAETGQRGYLLTRDEAYLQPYLRASREIDGKFRELLEHVPRDLSETEKPGRMGRLIQLKLLELQETIELRSNDPDRGLERALEIVNGDQGQHYMQEIQRLAGETRRAETERLNA